jgi:signal transduction histidine kinase
MVLKPISWDQPVHLMRRMAHDMRGPLSVLSNTGEMFSNGMYGELTPQQARAIARMQRNTHRMLALLDDLMVFIKGEAGELVLNPISFDTREMIAGWQTVVQSLADEKEIALEFVVDDDLPPHLVGDVSAIRRIALALLWNALMFTEEGQVEVDVAWVLGHGLQVRVTDTGPGIPPDAAPHIFEPFWRGEERMEGPTSGFGVGLAMALTVTRLMRGSLVLEDTGPGGSVFCLRLPLKKALV